jgi:hypothetical protein
MWWPSHELCSLWEVEINGCIGTCTSHWGGGVAAVGARSSSFFLFSFSPARRCWGSFLFPWRFGFDLSALTFTFSPLVSRCSWCCTPTFLPRRSLFFLLGVGSDLGFAAAVRLVPRRALSARVRCCAGRAWRRVRLLKHTQSFDSRSTTSITLGLRAGRPAGTITLTSSSRTSSTPLSSLERSM